MTDVQDQGSGGTVGDRLRIAREAKGISLDEVARQSRIPVRHLEHIERGEWDALPAITYSVGFARSYANIIGLDGPAIGAEVRQELGVSRNVAAGPAAYYEPADPARVPPRSIWIIAGVLAILLVAGYLIWRNSVVKDATADETAIAEGTAPTADVPPPANSQPRPQAAPAPSANGPVTLAASEDVWVRIYEPGKTPALFQGVLKAGQTYQVPATAQAPQIRTGRANVLNVSVGGTRVAPLGPPERTISDVSLKAADLLARSGNAGPGAPAAPAPAPAPR
jgi:cytoskeleton protein RodZ